MKKLVRIMVLAVGSLLLFTATGFATGIGFYTDLAGGAGEAEWDDAYGSFDIDLTSLGLGFALDTGPTSKGLFSYRLLAGYEGQVMEDDAGVDVDLGGVSIENVFAFAFVRRPTLRLWAGPLVRIGAYSGDSETHATAPGYVGKVDLDNVWELGFGGVFGANFKVAKRMIFAPTIGFRYVAGGGEGELLETELASGTTNRYVDDLTFYASMAFINLTVLFE